MGGIRTDGTDLVWAQMYDYQRPYVYGRVELWASPFATQASELAPRYVTDLPYYFVVTNLYFGARRAALVQSTQLVTIYSINDGRVVGVLLPPSDTEWRGDFIQYMAADELAISPLLMRSLYPTSSTIRFVRYDSLPPE